MKHATTPQARRSKRLETDLSEGGPSSVVETPPMPRQQTGHGGAQEIQRGQEAMQLNLQALTSTISAAPCQRPQYSNADTISCSRASCTN